MLQACQDSWMLKSPKISQTHEMGTPERNVLQDTEGDPKAANAGRQFHSVWSLWIFSASPYGQWRLINCNKYMNESIKNHRTQCTIQNKAAQVLFNLNIMGCKEAEWIPLKIQDFSCTARNGFQGAPEEMKELHPLFLHRSHSYPWEQLNLIHCYARGNNNNDNN